VRVTKPRPSWSERLALVLAVGLALTVAADASWAASRKDKASKPSRAKVPAHKRPAKPAPRRAPGEEFGSAEVLPEETIGLHGKASFYSPKFSGRLTATGERFDARALTGASNHFPLRSWVAVRRLDTGRCVAVMINDRMAARQTRRVIDLSRAAAEELHMISAGVVMVRIAPLQGVARGGEKMPEQACHAAFALEEAASCPTCAANIQSAATLSLQPETEIHPPVGQ